jgi:hypothetical protein
MEVMMEKYRTLLAFFHAYESKDTNITIEDIDHLETRLRADGYSVRELKNGSVIVRQPSELEASAHKRKLLQQREAQKYTKLGAAIPMQTAKAFADACRSLGVSQSKILLPVIQDTIKRVQQGGCP